MCENISASSKTFWAGLCTLFSTCRWVQFKKFFWKKIRYILSFSHTEQTLFGIQSKTFQQGCPKNYLKSQSLPEIERKVFFLLSKKLQQCCQNCIPRVYGNSSNEIFSWKKVFSFFYIIRTLSEKMRLFIIYFTMGLAKVYSTCPWEHFDGKKFYKLFQVSTSFSDYDWKKIDFPSNFFGQGWKNWFICLNRYDLRKLFRQKNFSLSLLGNEQKLSGDENSILRVRMNNLRNFFEKNVLFYDFRLLCKLFQFFCQKTSSRTAKTEMYVSTTKLGKKIFCWKNCVCAIFFQKWTKNIWSSGESFSAALWKLLLMCP